MDRSRGGRGVQGVWTHPGKSLVATDFLRNIGMDPQVKFVCPYVNNVDDHFLDPHVNNDLTIS